jgi:hypothetical protein
MSEALSTLVPEQIKQNRITWIKALRNPHYEGKQGTGLLRIIDDDDDEEFCCLGVACDSNSIRPITTWTNRGELTPSELSQLRMSCRMQDYLISMNDGEYLYEVRRSQVTRSFHFIARFLEVVWGLSNETV